jgi:CHC2 zinc finger
MSKSLATSNYKQNDKRSKRLSNADKLTVAEVIELVKMSVDIEQAADRYLGVSLTDIKGSRRTKMIRCPFHDEKTASFSISQVRNGFKCFGCGVQGDVINLVALQEKVSLARAAYIIAENFGLTKGLDSVKKHELAAKNNDKVLVQKFKKNENSAFLTLAKWNHYFQQKIRSIKVVSDLDRYGDYYHAVFDIERALDLMLNTEDTEYQSRIDNVKVANQLIKKWIFPVISKLEKGVENNVQ